MAETHAPRGTALLGYPAEVPTGGTQPMPDQRNSLSRGIDQCWPAAAIWTNLYIVRLPAVGSSGLPERTAMLRGQPEHFRPPDPFPRRGSSSGVARVGCWATPVSGMGEAPASVSGPRAALGGGLALAAPRRLGQRPAQGPPHPTTWVGSAASPEPPPQTAWRAGSRWSPPYTVL